ncbi:TPA: nucleoside 2-deoxyribosyltransferase [Pseudomonas aeruginosa]|uniref:nucleoside 2-deoxyribosyltransferase n=1 Tax=Pseudomonas aeruginosa TaxID=287 RepID=UPI0021E1BCAC|nr:nucleoside 2-deoxyribosyltransferase [Pseudomonas aeruginosa]WJQ21073.1 nucleoside 2-deoxyribosyltransferase [Pseudomonas aeruginosa]GLE65912.1 hypothetical protein VNPA110516_61010 [Pseudomonas aeruginosa]GLE78101.1 hypothetical protein VNPA120641_49710 [Pseudomonas aeruginosa]GLE92828.1 hypothetical protein VNPA120719_62250 [Pseudomonas aeruginosa]HCL3751763.1 nucleoside 2-deoxyribosyltransferase [Pseudomonas aeruginosa]
MTAIYLAGPDVFRPDAEAHGAMLKALCAEFGFVGLYPLDHALPADIREPAAQAAWVYRANVGLIERADCVLANLEPFRGSEPDSGTAFEVGYALALGKPVYAYLSDAGAYAERLARLAPEWLGEHPGEDRDGWQLEGFGLPLNLMLAVPSRLVAGGPREALRRLAEELGGNA